MNLINSNYFRPEFLPNFWLIFPKHLNLPNSTRFQDLRELNLRNVDELHADSWTLINDTLKTDASLLFPPYIIALGGLIVWQLFASVFREKPAEQSIVLDQNYLLMNF